MISDINKLELDVKWQNLTPGCTIVGSCTAEVFRTEERLSPGHRMCAGCGATIAVRNVLRGLHEEDEAVITGEEVTNNNHSFETSRRRRSGYHLCNRVP